jgi:hypothetical protein
MSRQVKRFDYAGAFISAVRLIDYSPAHKGRDDRINEERREHYEVHNSRNGERRLKLLRLEIKVRLRAASGFMKPGSTKPDENMPDNTWKGWRSDSAIIRTSL